MFKDTYAVQAEQDEATATTPLAPSLGRFAGIGRGGAILVSYGGIDSRPARLVTGINRSELMKPGSIGREVVLLFADGDLNQPIVVGLVEDSLDPDLSSEATTTISAEPSDVRVDGNRLTLEARDEIVLKCGEGSITLRKDGKITIRGKHLLSRSSGPIRVKGARVDIN